MDAILSPCYRTQGCTDKGIGADGKLKNGLQQQKERDDADT